MSAARDTWIRFAEGTGLPIAAEAAHVADLFGPEMTRYLELIRSPGDGPIGFMVRGEGASFTERALSVLRAWEMPLDAVDHHRRLADRFEHKRSFLKLEWSRAPGSDHVDHLAAYYFRRRPEVPEMLRHFWMEGVAPGPLDRAMQLAEVLEKGSIHFVSGAMRPGHALEHKLYFSQLVAPDRRAAVTRRIEGALRLAGIDDAAIERFLRAHDILLPRDREETVFVSMRFDAASAPAYLKIDYPKVAIPSLLACLPEPERAAARMEAQRLCIAAGAKELSFLGVTVRSESAPRFKYYADLTGQPGDGLAT